MIFLSDNPPPASCNIKTVAPSSPPTFMCGVAKPERRVRTCPPQLVKHSKANLERFHTEPSISHHKYSLHMSSEHPQGTTLHGTSWTSTRKSRAPRVTLREVVNSNSACVCDNRRFIGIRDLLKEDEDLEPNEVGMRTAKLLSCIAHKVSSEIPFEWLLRERNLIFFEASWI